MSPKILVGKRKDSGKRKKARLVSVIDIDKEKVLRFPFDASLNDNAKAVMPIAKQLLFDANSTQFYKIGLIRAANVMAQMSLQVVFVDFIIG